jgi:hypothetical protein
LREYFAGKPTLQDMLKEVLQKEQNYGCHKFSSTLKEEEC